MGVTGNTQTTALKNALVANVVQKELAAAAKLPQFCMDVSMFAVPGAKSISFPKGGSFTAENRTSGAAGTKQDITWAVDQLDLSHRAYVGWLIDATDALQSNMDVQREYIKRAVTAHARYVDTQILAEATSDAGDTVTAGAITKAKILEMRESILSANGNLEDTVLVINPASETVLLGLDEFTRADVYGSSNIPNGVIGRVYGVNVIVHNNMTSGFNAVMFEKSGLALGFQSGAKYGEQDAIEYGVGAKLCAVDQLFGVKSMHNALMGAASGKSPLIVSLASA